MNTSTSPQRIIPPGMAAGVPIVGEDAPRQSGIVTPDGRPASPPAPPPNPLAREHLLTFDRAEVDAAVDAQLQKLRPQTEIKGFRKGHAPMEVLRRHFGPKRLSAELTRRAEQRFNEEKLNTNERIVGGVGSLRLVSDPPAENGDYRVRCGYEIFPDVQPPDFNRIRVGKPVVSITDDDVERMIERLQHERGQFVPVERVAQEGDLVAVDYQATERGVRVDGATDRQWIVGSPQVDAISGAIVGARAGDVRSLDLQHGPDHPDPEFRGRRLRLRIAIKRVAELRIPELNDEFYALLGVTEGGMEKFRESVREMTEGECKRRIQLAVRERSLLALAMATPPFPLPRILVQGEAATLRRQDLEIARQQGLPPAAANANATQYAILAAQRVRSGLAVDAWRRRENFLPAREETEARLDEVAQSYDDPDEFKRQALANPEIMGNVELQIVEDRAAEWAAEQAGIEEQPMTMGQLWGWDPMPPPESSGAQNSPQALEAGHG